MRSLANHLNLYLETIGRPIKRKVHMGGEAESKKNVDLDVQRQAFNQLESQVQKDRDQSILIVYVIIALSVAWFLLCSWLIVENRDQLSYVLGFFGGQLVGLGAAVSFLACLWRQKSNIENLLLVLPVLPFDERTSVIKSFLLSPNNKDCIFGK